MHCTPRTLKNVCLFSDVIFKDVTSVIYFLSCCELSKGDKTLLLLLYKVKVKSAYEPSGPSGRSLSRFL